MNIDKKEFYAEDDATTREDMVRVPQLFKDAATNGIHVHERWIWYWFIVLMRRKDKLETILDTLKLGQ